MQIFINGEKRDITSNCTVFELLDEKGVTPKAAVVELNGEILKQELWQNTSLNAGDKLEILIFMGGG